MGKGRRDFILLFFFLGMLLYRLNMFSIIQEFGHLAACWMTGSRAVLKDWVTVEASFITPFSLYAGFVFQGAVLYFLSVLFIRRDISYRWGFLFWGAFHGAIIIGYLSTDFNKTAIEILGHEGLAELGKNIWLAVTLPAAGLGWYLHLKSIVYNQNQGFLKFMSRIRKRLGRPVNE